MRETDLSSVERTLERLGVEELEERLELTPVLAPGGETVDGEGCCCNLCTCKVEPMPQDMSWQEQYFNK